MSNQEEVCVYCGHERAGKFVCCGEVHFLTTAEADQMFDDLDEQISKGVKDDDRKNALSQSL